MQLGVTESWEGLPPSVTRAHIPCHGHMSVSNLMLGEVLEAGNLGVEFGRAQSFLVEAPGARQAL